MTQSARDLVNSHLDDAPADSEVQPNTQATSDETVGLYDYPPEDPRSREHVIGRREPRFTKNNIQYRAERARSESQRRKSNDTRARNASLRRAQVQDPATQREGCNAPSTGASTNSGGRGRSRAVRPLSSHPPESTVHIHDQPTQEPGESQYTYVYETLDHEGLVKYAQEEFDLDVQGCDTQTIIGRLQLAEAKQKAQVGPPRRPASIVVLPPTPLQVGGGWSQDVVGSSQATSSFKKRSSGASNPPNSSSKRQRMVTEPDDTATEPETDDEPIGNSATSTPMTTGHVAAGSANLDPSTRPSQHGMHAPPPTREATLATVIDTPVSNVSSHSLGGSVPPSRSNLPDGSIPSVHRLPSLAAPLRGPTHARLRIKLLKRYFDSTEASQTAADDTNDQTDEPQSTDVDEVPETAFGSASNASQHATCGTSSTRRTYNGPRSHLPSRPEAAGDLTDTTEEPSRPNSPTLTPSQLVQRERARAAAAKGHAEITGLAPRRRPHLFASASQPPVSRPQARPPPGGRGNAVGRHAGGTRRLDPVSAARADMLAFNRAVAQGEATSFVESAKRQSERTARCAPPASRPADELLDDDEETLAQAEAYAKGKWPQPPFRTRKPKPLARDVSGVERQVLIVAKIHLFAYALVEGIYQTRATFLRWASAVHQATWQMELPNRPYMPPDNEIFEIVGY
ncbi:unnamed protein product [Rhizoctonia solani]|uniref:Uncharacterized protein n=1 Tax=Rhizoctonia solani TaxID=456999 RepID=A0A8H3DPK7_9AGAM|nr:unnamed protein product [Rhizoctonia solani]